MEPGPYTQAMLERYNLSDSLPMLPPLLKAPDTHAVQGTCSGRNPRIPARREFPRPTHYFHKSKKCLRPCLMNEQAEQRFNKRPRNSLRSAAEPGVDPARAAEVVLKSHNCHRISD